MRYADAGRAFRYSAQRLHMPETPHDTTVLRRGGGSERLAYAVHSAIAGQLLASYSRLAETRRFSVWTITALVGRDPSKAADRKAVQRCLVWLDAIGAVHYSPGTGRGPGSVEAIALPEPPADWLDATAQPFAQEDDPLDVPDPDGAQLDDAPVLAAAKLDDRPADPVIADAEGATATPEGCNGYPRRVKPSHPKGEALSPLSEKQSEKQSEQASEKPADEREPVSACSPAADDRPKANPETARTPERVSDTPKANTGKQAETDGRAETLARLIPPNVAQRHPGGAIELARNVLTRTDAKHSEAVAKLAAFLDADALDDLRMLLDAKAKQLPADVRSVSGLLLAWCRDLPAAPPFTRADYAYGFPFRDALKDAGLGGKWGRLTLGTLALAARVLLDAGHDPARDPDGFLAVLAATLLPHGDPAHGANPNALVPLQRYAAGVQPLPFTIPANPPSDDVDPPALDALAHVGLGGTDPRIPAGFVSRDPSPARGGWR